jgi:hypothetical protein
LGLGVGAGIGAGIGLSDRVNLRDRNNFDQRRNDKMANWQDRLQDSFINNPNRDNWENARDQWHDNHQDWNDWHDNYHDWHNDWHHGYAGHDYGDWWHHMWDEHPVAATLGVTSWGLNALSYGWGYAPYYNPYYAEPVVGSPVVYDYSQPIVEMSPPVVVVSDSTAPAAAPATAPATAPAAPAPTPQQQTGLQVFDQAREAFKAKRYDEALSLTDKALKDLPKDAILHEFRAIALFALGRYRESAAPLHAVLAVSPGMDWTTLGSLFADTDEYTRHLRALEDYTKANPNASEGPLLLYYFYKTGGHKDAAARQIKRVTELQPQDALAQQLLSMITPANPDAESRRKEPTQKYTKDQLAGSWNTKASRGTIKMDLNKDGTFQWTYKEGTKTEDIRGIFEVHGDEIAMQPDTGGTMLAELNLTQPSTLNFKMVGGPEKDSGLNFTKQ